MNDLETFIKLKYQLPAAENLINWKNPESIPATVRYAWCWRCVKSIEYCTKGHPDVENFIKLAKLYTVNNLLSSDGNLIIIYDRLKGKITDKKASIAASAAKYSAFSEEYPYVVICAIQDVLSILPCILNG